MMGSLIVFGQVRTTQYFIALFSGADPGGGPGGPDPPLTLGFEAPKLSIFGPYLIFPQFFLPRFARHIISLICCLFIVQIEKFFQPRFARHVISHLEILVSHILGY